MIHAGRKIIQTVEKHKCYILSRVLKGTQQSPLCASGIYFQHIQQVAPWQVIFNSVVVEIALHLN